MGPREAIPLGSGASSAHVILRARISDLIFIVKLWVHELSHSMF